jgi:mannose/cellobiose epimerase-like protein (N-acyl-D-glucosamine 2-epimerase family)
METTSDGGSVRAFAPHWHQAILPFFSGTVVDGGGGFHSGSLSSKMLAP